MYQKYHNSTACQFISCKYICCEICCFLWTSVQTCVPAFQLGCLCAIYEHRESRRHPKNIFYLSLTFKIKIEGGQTCIGLLQTHLWNHYQKLRLPCPTELCNTALPQATQHAPCVAFAFEPLRLCAYCPLQGLSTQPRQWWPLPFTLSVALESTNSALKELKWRCKADSLCVQDS